MNSAVRAPPIWRKPVGEGAMRVTISDMRVAAEFSCGLVWVGRLLARPSAKFEAERAAVGLERANHLIGGGKSG